MRNIYIKSSKITVTLDMGHGEWFCCLAKRCRLSSISCVIPRVLWATDFRINEKVGDRGAQQPGWFVVGNLEWQVGWLMIMPYLVCQHSFSLWQYAEETWIKLLWYLQNKTIGLSDEHFTAICCEYCLQSNTVHKA